MVDTVGRLKKIGQTVWLPLALIGLFWVARYWHSSQFGLYEDDLTVVPRAVSLSTPELLDYVGNFIVHLYDDGRPLFNSLNYLLSAFGWRAAGMMGPYLLGFLIESVNVVLFYTLIRRVYGKKVAAFAGVAYVLYSADTTQVWLHRSLGAEPSLTLVFLALHAYVSDRLVLAYGMAAVILFSYESPYTIFLCAPLLTNPRGSSQRREWIRHLAITLALLGAAYLMRRAIGTERVIGYELGEMLQTSAVHAVVGPVVSLGTYALRPLQTVASLNREALLAAALSLPVFLLLLSGRWGTGTEGAHPPGQAGGGLRAVFQAYARPLLTGLAMLCSSYLLTFTVRAYAISGRDTRVHFAAGAGAALVVAVLAALLWDALHARGKGRLGALLIAGEAALLIGFGQVIQRDYQVGWVSQQRFWSALVTQIPDVRNGTVVLVEPGPLGDVTQIGANTWNLPRVLEQLYVFPPDWDQPPRVVRLEPNWRQHILSGEGPLQLDWRSVLSLPSVWGEVEGKNVILFLEEGGVLVRQSGPMDIAGQMTSLMTTGQRGEPPYPHRLLYDLLIRNTLPD